MRLLAVVIAVCVLSGCRKPRPSLEYSEAQNAHSLAVARLGDDAYLDPEMERIEQLLARVPADSADAAAARELSATIASERKRVTAEEAARQAALANALTPPPMPDSPGGPQVPDSAPEPAAPVDAGDGQNFPPGMTVAELIAASGGCFEAGDQITVRTGTEDTRAQLYVVKALHSCQLRLSRYEGRALVVQGGKVLTSTATSELKSAAGLPAEQQPPPPRAAPVDAGGAPPERLLPGAPRYDYDGGP